MVAGVCAAVGRATNTDPVLWRVLFAVLTLAGGVGLLAYLVGWLLIPAEGDTGSPVEALLGRGRSGTSPVLVIVVGVIAAITLGSVMYHGLRAAAILVALALGALILISRSGSRPAGTPTAGGPPTAGYSDPMSDIPPWRRPGGPMWTGPVPAAPTATAAPEASPVPPVPPAQTMPMSAPAAAAGTAYRPPFAPHGPYEPSSRYPYPGLGATPPPPPPAPSPPPAPHRRRPPSRLGRVTFSLALLVLGVIGLLDIRYDVPFTTYAAAALATLGAGLLVGAWFGRARWLIPLGVITTLVLGVGATLDRVHVAHWDRNNGDITWTPTSVTMLADRYQQNFGDAMLDLSNVDFSGTTRSVTVQLNAGDLTILLPDKVDTTVNAAIHIGDAQVFGEHWGGFGSPRHQVIDDGPDGPGGGTLVLDVRLNAGDLEVHR
jgi:phage shock protein PspC (stress-responsive transcriptional regulator)